MSCPVETASRRFGYWIQPGEGSRHARRAFNQPPTRALDRGRRVQVVLGLARAQAIGLAAFTVIGLTALTFKPTRWNTTCSWRYFVRALGPSLIQSPFPVGPVSCGAWHLYINESPYSPYQRSRGVEAMNDAGCALP